MLLLHVGAQTRVVSWSPRGSGTTTTLLASPRYAYSSSPLQGLSYSCTYGLIWFHLCLFIFRKIYKPLDLLVFQLLVKVGSFVAWPVFCTYEETAIAAEYSKLLGLEEVEAFLLLARLPISENTLLNSAECTITRKRVFLFPCLKI